MGIKKARVIVTTKCNRKCPKCCNKNLDFTKIKQMRWSDIVHECYDEIIEFQNTGILCEGKVREVHNKINEYIDVHDVRMIEKDLLQEMARRWREI